MAPDLVSIHPWTLIPDRSLEVDVMVWDPKLMTAVKCFEAGQVITRTKFDQLARYESQKFYVNEKAFSEYRQYLASALDEGLQNDMLPRLLKLTLLCESVRFQLEDSLAGGSMQKWVDTAYSGATLFTEKVDSIHKAGKELPSVLRKDGGFVTHAFNTGLYAYALARELRASNLDQKESMVGGFLHDTGKLNLDPDYPDQLSLPAGYLASNSREECASHCVDGMVFLSKVAEMTQAPLLASYQHHEHIDASGYPVGVPADELPQISRIVGLANRFDGLLCDRKGREGVSRIIAWKVIEAECGHLWDEEIGRCLERILNRPLQSY